MPGAVSGPVAGGNHLPVSTALQPDQRGPWLDELVSVVRGMSGGLLFGVPLLYTMEVWWTGEHTSPLQGLGLLLITLVPVAALNRTAGFRKGDDATWPDAILDAVEALGIGVLLAAVILVLVREITGATPIHTAAAKIAYEAFPFGLGVAVANHFLSGKNRSASDRSTAGEGGQGEDGGEGGQGGGGGKDGKDDGKDTTINGTIADLGATLVGAGFIALNIAPTQEVPTLSSAMGAPWHIALIAFSLVVTYAIVFVAGFAGQGQRQDQQGILQRPLTETAAAYLVSVVASALMLWVFQQMQGPPVWMLGQAVVLAFPASIGGAAGRLAI